MFEEKAQQYLESLDIEFLDEEKYTTSCPKCGGDRSKSNIKSLQVYLEEPYVRYQCFHANQCEWNTQQYKNIMGSTEMKTKRSYDEYINVPEGIKPPVPKGAVLYAYKNTYSEILFYIVRTTDKKFFPMSYTVDGEFVAKARNILSLYGAETLSNKPVIVVEGEKAADAARKIFKKASVVTWAGGANGMNRGDWSLLKNREVTLWPDNDEAGIKAMETIATLIDSRNVYMVDTSSLPPKADLADDVPLDQIEEIYKTRVNVSAPLIEGALDKESFIKSLSKIQTGLPLGWEHMNKTLRMPQSGLVIVEGRSGHGKTTFMLNVAVNMLQQTARKVAYFSYEIPATRMLLKLMMCVEGVQKDPVPHKNEEAYRKELLAGELGAWKKMQDYLSTRFFITDCSMNIDKMVKTLDKDEFNDSIIFIDYMQLIPSTSQANRYLVIKQFADSLREIANKRNQVIFAGSQLTNGETPYQDTTREGKDIMNAAELVLKVWNKTVADAHDEVKKGRTKEGETRDHYYNKAEGDFVVDTKKNRNGQVGLQYGFNLKYGAKLEETVTQFKEF